MNKAVRILGALGIFATGYLLGTRGETPAASAEQAAQQSSERVFELRTYTAPPGRHADMLKRFQDHATTLFDKHGMRNIIYLVPTDTPQSRNTLVYLIAHESREQATRNWAAFRADTVWQRVNRETTANGPIVERVVSVFTKPAPFSPIK